MADSKLGKTNFMQHLSHNGNFQATDLKSMEQASRECIMDNKCRAEEPGRGGYPPNFPIGEDDWERRRRLLDYQARRKELGGSTFRPWDALANGNPDSL